MATTAPTFESLEIWGDIGSHDIAVGPVEGGVAVAQIVTTNGIGIMTEAASERAAKYAHLIAASPDLLRALEIILPDFRQFVSLVELPAMYHAQINIAMSAIAKAKGEQ